jgi:hypothetical protein
MKSEPAPASQCVEVLARLELELGAKLDDFFDGVLAADAAQARRELRAWCGFAVVMMSGLTVIALLVAPLR